MDLIHGKKRQCARCGKKVFADELSCERKQWVCQNCYPLMIETTCQHYGTPWVPGVYEAPKEEPCLVCAGESWSRVFALLVLREAAEPLPCREVERRAFPELLAKHEDAAARRYPNQYDFFEALVYFGAYGDKCSQVLRQLEADGLVKYRKKDRTYEMLSAPKPKVPPTSEQLALRAKAAEIRADLNPKTQSKVVEVLDLVDHGPSDNGEGSAICPHCGAFGRYVYRFICEDGSQRGAMKGCFGMWPKHPFAEISGQILERERQREQMKPPQRLASWDVHILEAIHRFALKQLTELETTTLIRTEQIKARNFRLKRFGRVR